MLKVTENELDKLYELTFGNVPPAMDQQGKVQAVVLTNGIERVIHMTQEIRSGKTDKLANR